MNICFQPLCDEPGRPWTEIYDPHSDTFAPLTSFMKGWNNVYTATLLANGNVLFVGYDGYHALDPIAELFDPVDGRFTTTASASDAHAYGTATLLPDGGVLLTGGMKRGVMGQMDAEIYSPASDTFSAVGSMTAGRALHTATLLQDGTVLIAGGLGNHPASAEIYRPAGQGR